jgi:hypothetical protein
MNNKKLKKLIIIMSLIIIILIALFIIIILNKNKHEINLEHDQIYKINITINLIDKNGNNDIIFSDNNISEVKITGVDLYSPSIFIISFNEIEDEKLKNITRNNIGGDFFLYYHNKMISSLNIIKEINNNQLIFENIDDEILLDIINNIFEKK